MTQLVARVEDSLAQAIDELVSAGVVASRSEAVRQGLQAVVDRARRDAVAAAIVAGYERHPQTAEEVGWSDGASVRMIAEEPW